ncbi:putative membrane protein [Rickettsia hoogstraalii str. RCCE3]|nr:putative membrane protein [Rickettsia hoogstraalii str. RCCE3]KJV77987.1 putative membrane protein [Rickettsia hoogstraalii str. RCCE3]KJV80059.1 putative membrane protein [Rickettsia hoogstraalii str. RCCE3]
MNVKNKDVIEKENNKQYLRIIYNLLPLLLIFCLNVILPEIALGETLEGQLDRIGGLSTGKLKTIGISGATILSSIWAVVRGNLRLAGAIVAIGIILGFYLEWVSSGMKIS